MVEIEDDKTALALPGTSVIGTVMYFAAIAMFGAAWSVMLHLSAETGASGVALVIPVVPIVAAGVISIGFGRVIETLERIYFRSTQTAEAFARLVDESRRG